MTHAIATVLAALSMSAGTHAIQTDIGPGTHATPCKRISAHAIRCGFYTPGVNIGIEDPELEATFESFAIAKRRPDGKIEVWSPMLGTFVNREQVR